MRGRSTDLRPHRPVQPPATDRDPHSCSYAQLERPFTFSLSEIVPACDSDQRMTVSSKAQPFSAFTGRNRPVLLPRGFWSPREAELVAVTLRLLQQHRYEGLTVEAVAATARATPRFIEKANG